MLGAVAALAEKDAEIARLRAELTEARAALAPLDAVVYELEIEDSETSPADAIQTLRAELAREVEQSKICLDSYAAENQRFSDEIARLREALSGVRKDLAPIHMCDVVHPGCKICDAVLRIDATLDPPEGKGE